jgi:SAM-dependent methyltransferase
VTDPSRRVNATPFAVAIFLSSSLLFLIEPIAGKRLLPLLGGSAAVWTACLVFFQSALLLGYFTAHWLVTRAGPRRQATLYVALLALSLAQLALGISLSLHANPGHPIASVLWLLTLLIGMPFVTLSVTSPLLQAWYARAAHASSAEARPYGLFAISNVGSLLSLLIYPWLIEPRLSLHAQSTTLTLGFVALAFVCGTIAWSTRELPLLPAPDPAVEVGVPITTSDRALWIGLAACASLLLSAMTTHISQNVATIPLLWILHLIAYLLSFVAAFSSERWQPRWLVAILALAGLGGSGYLVYKGVLSTPIERATAIYVVSLFAICWFCHSELYRRRPSAARLTSFYFLVAAGGAIGAVMVGIVAPMVLPGSYELAFGLCAAAVLGMLAMWNSGWVPRAVWFTTAGFLAAVVVTQVKNDRVNTIVRVRNFYGTLQVTQIEDAGWHAPIRTLYHGVITHGRQIFREDLRGAATTYYGHKTAVGYALDLCCDGRPRRIGVIGLGSGTLAVYGQPGDTIRFYDINPAVPSIARNTFTYLRDSKATIEIAIGDARVSLAQEPPQRFDVLAIDAFSGDAIPVHLITEEALTLYRRHMRPGGIIVFHVSNRYLDLKPVVRQLAQRAGMSTAFISPPDDNATDAWTADWIAVTFNEHFINDPDVAAATVDVTVPPNFRLWTDDYNSLLPILKFRMKESE